MGMSGNGAKRRRFVEAVRKATRKIADQRVVSSSLAALGNMTLVSVWFWHQVSFEHIETCFFHEIEIINAALQSHRSALKMEKRRKPNKRMHTNRRPALQLERSGFFGRWIRCQRPSPAAVGDPWR